MKLQKIAFCSIIGVCFIYLIVLQIHAIWSFNIDDAFISLRYAKNWANGFGLVWNVGEPPVEGYSNFSFVFLAYIALHFGINPLLVLKVTGIFGLILSALLVYGISRYWAPSRLAWIPSAWLLMYVGEIVWSTSGLETAIYQALVCSSVYFIFQGMGFRFYPLERGNYQTLPFVIAAFSLSLAGMTRPEAPALMVLFCLLLFITEIPLGSTKRKQFFSYFVIFCVVIFVTFAPYFAWRLFYYGRLFPNSVYCKGIAPILNFDLTKNYWVLIWPFMVLALPPLWKKDKRSLFLCLPGILYSIMLLHSDPIVAFYNRLFLPAFALMLPLAFCGLQTIISWYLKENDGIYDTIIYFTSFVIGFLCIPSFTLAQYQQFSEYPQKGEQLRLNVASWLNHNIPTNQSVVLGDSGLVPFETPHAYIDSYCLNNAKMTQNPSPNMYQDFCQQILKQAPSTIILTALIENGKTTYAPADACLTALLPNDKQYQKALTLKTGDAASSYRYEIYTRLNKSKPAPE